MSTGWRLGIDFGTSYTVAAVAADGAVNVVDVESNGRDRIPSSVFLTEDGQLLVGSAAQHQAVFAPERYEPTPKRLLNEGSVFLGDRMVPVAELAAAMLLRVYTEACRQQGERAPEVIRLTHPADWGETRLVVLREAVERAGLSEVTLVPEPVAAAVRIAFRATSPGQQIAVYDFGGGTFDAAILRRTHGDFEVAGPPAGRDPLGGEDIDARIVDYLGGLLSVDHADEWRQLRNPGDVNWRRAAAGLRGEVQRAKETLSEVGACQLWVPGLDCDVQLTRAELDEMITADVEATVDTFEVALRDAEVGAEQLAGLYLVGGSSRIPLVASTLWRRLGVRPMVQDNPKSVVAMGAAGWIQTARSSRRPHLVSGAGGPLDRSAGTFGSRPAMSLDAGLWPSGFSCTAELRIDHRESPAATIRARDDPAGQSGAEDVARRAGDIRRARMPGYHEQSLAPAQVLGAGLGLERRFTAHSSGQTVPRFEQYLVSAGRAFAVAAPEAARAVAEQLRLTGSSSPSHHLFESRFLLELPADWTLREQVALRRKGTTQVVSLAREVLEADAADAWRAGERATVMTLPGATLVGQVEAVILNDLPGEILTVRWRRDGTSMLTKLGLATLDDNGIGMRIDLPHSEQAAFPALARHATLV
jgi:actin-like ATPase involved in cell morphogenesis